MVADIPNPDELLNTDPVMQQMAGFANEKADEIGKEQEAAAASVPPAENLIPLLGAIS
jgi:hypothetical protein